jgi:hypothetical protein
MKQTANFGRGGTIPLDASSLGTSRFGRWEMVVREALVIVLMAMVMAGCSRSKASAPATPEALVKRMMEASSRGDKEQLLSCFTGTGEELKAMESVAEFITAALSFRDKFIKTYGEQAWKDFQSPEGGPREGNATLDVVTEADIREAAKMEILVERNRARFTPPGETQEVVAVRTDGGWLIQVSSLLPPNADPESFATMMSVTAAEVSKYEEAIGRQGIKPEDIDAELGRALMKVIVGASTNAPHRFDIDNLP